MFSVNIIATYFSFKMSLKMLNLVKNWCIYENISWNFSVMTRNEVKF